jgi:hypothetical protein
MGAGQHYDVFLSHAHEDREWVEELARRLEDEQGFRVWLDRWILIPGQSFQQAMAKGLEEADTCAVALGEKTPTGWFRQEIEHALNRQVAQPTFRVIPVLLPDASHDSTDAMPAFLDLRTWADFRKECDPGYAFHVLTQGIKGEPVGRWPIAAASLATETSYSFAERKLKQLRELTRIGEVSDVVTTEFQQKILSRWLEEDDT